MNFSNIRKPLWQIGQAFRRPIRVSDGKKKSSFVMTTRQILVNLFLLTVGGAVYVVGLSSILMPQKFLNGGMMGIGLIIYNLFPSVHFGLVYLLLNIPLVVLGWFSVSNRFIVYTGFGILIFSLLAEVIHVSPLPIKEPILAAILAGIICGIGAGIILRSAGSAGGLDILAVYVYRRFSLPMGWTGMMVNTMVLGLGAFFFNLEMALYTLIFVFTQGKVIDSVVTGFNRRKAMLIISDKSREIADAIMTNLRRGVTFLDGTGAYTGNPKQVVFSVIMLTELARVKTLIFAVDPDAFVVINDTLDVLGHGISRQRVY
jgi:uncharacterized membrane-anchored protein YitT (DUF2179 family)